MKNLSISMVYFTGPIENQALKKALLLFLFLGILHVSALAQNVTIPDANFKSYLVTSFDKNGDGEIQAAEAEAVTLISANSTGIADATGIEAFINLTTLFLNDNTLSTIDVSSNEKLTALFVNNSDLTTIDLSNNTDLQYLLVEGNQLNSLDLTQQASTLLVLSIGNNPGTASFDISGLTQLLNLLVNSSSLTTLDISSNPSVSALVATDNPSLTCVTVADPTYDWASNATVDGSVVFTDNCSNPLVVIPDINLKNALLAHTPDIDTNDDGEIRTDEAIAFTGALALAGLNIEEATGVEAFVNATGIDLSDNSVFRLNLDANTALTSVSLFENNLHYFSIKNGNNTAITSMDVSDNDDMVCMSVDDLTHANANWTFPLATSLSTDCSIIIPDVNFKAALLAHSPVIDLNDDDEISLSEATSFSGRMNLLNKSITDLTGVAAFPNMSILSCGTNNLTTIDLSQNKKVNQIDLQQNDLTSLILGNNNVISHLILTGNQFSTLDLSTYPTLRTLLCNDNNLASLAVSSELTYLSFSGNPVSPSFNYTGLTELTTLIASGTEIPTPDVSNLVNLESLTCIGCEIDEIDLSNNTKLKSINLGNNNLESIDLTNNNLIASLSVNGNSLSSLDVSNLTGLTVLNAYDNVLTSLDANNGTVIGTLRAYSNPDLACISVGNPDFAAYFSTVDMGTLFYTDCSSFPIDFPDSNFEQALLAHTPVIDSNDDGMIQTDEAANFSGTLNVSGQSISDPTGLLFFENASSIDLSDNDIKWFISSIGDLSATTLDLSDNQLSLIKLTDVASSSITDLTLDNNANLICVNVDDLTFANANWTVSGAGVAVSDDCNVSIPDALFKADLIGDINIDVNDDDEIQLSEAEAYTGTIHTNVIPIADLTGIEAFVNLNWLNITTANLTEVDLSRNTQLTTLILSKNDIAAIDLSNNTMLTRLELGNNDLTSIDLSANDQLDKLYLLTNAIENIDLSGNSLLTYIELRFNELESINLKNGNNTAITYFDASSNDDLACLDVDDITYFDANFSDNVDQGVIFDTNCGDPLLAIGDANFLAALIAYSPSFDTNTDGDIRRSEVADFSGTLDISSSSITSLSGIEDFINLTGLIASDNQIVDLDVSKNESLIYLDASDNALESLDIRNGNNDNFSFFDATLNSLLSCIEVDYIDYATTNWTSIDAGVSFSRYCDPNESVYIPDVYLRNTLDISDTNFDDEISYAEAEAFTGDIVVNFLTENLQGIEFFPNMNAFAFNHSSNDNIEHFDFSHNTGLKELIISTGTASPATIDLSRNVALTELYLVNIALSSIDLSLYPDLELLYLFEYDLGTIDLSVNTKLVDLRLQDLGLTSIDLSTNTLLESVILLKNSLTSIDLTSNTAISELDLSETDLTSLDVSPLTSLQDLRAIETSLTTLDVSQNSALEYLTAGYGGEGAPQTAGTLTEVLLPSGSSLLQDVSLDNNSIESIVIDGFTNSDFNINLDNNHLVSLTVSGVTSSGASFYLDGNPLMYVDLSGITGASAEVSIQYTLLEYAKVGSLANLEIDGNPNLNCIEVDDITYAETNYTYDAEVSFTTQLCLITWDGSAWSNTTGPTDTDDVLIAGQYTYFGNGSFTCNNLKIATTGSLYVNVEGTLDVKGDINNNGIMRILNGSSLITYEGSTVTGNDIEFRRGTRYANGKYSFVGSPIEQNSETTGGDLGTYVYRYNEMVAYGADGINRWEDASTDELIPAKGYTQAFKEDIIFFGTPNTGTITYSGSYTEDTDDANEGWNLIANPYPAAIDVEDFLLANTNTSGAVYIWDDNGSDTQRGSNADYIIANGSMATNTTPAGGQTRYNNALGSSQGFFVKLNSAIDTDIEFTESMRLDGSNSDDNFFRQTQLPIARINLTNTKGLFKQAVIGFATNATENELNRTYDAHAFNATSANGIFTMKAGRSLALNGMTSDWESIQLQLNTKEAGLYTISGALEGYNESLYLVDNQTSQVIDLQNENYSFTAVSGIDTDRFQLLSSPQEVLSLDQHKVQVYAHNKVLHVQQSDNTIREYLLFDMRGKQLLNTSVNTETEVNLSAYPSGIYLVFDGIKTHKIILD